MVDARMSLVPTSRSILDRIDAVPMENRMYIFVVLMGHRHTLIIPTVPTVTEPTVYNSV